MRIKELKENELYYFICYQGYPISVGFDSLSSDELIKLNQIGLLFETEEQCLEYYKHRKDLLDLVECIEKHNEGSEHIKLPDIHALVLYNKSNISEIKILTLCPFDVDNYPKQFICKSKEVAEKVIEEYGEQKLIEVLKRGIVI